MAGPSTELYMPKAVVERLPVTGGSRQSYSQAKGNLNEGINAIRQKVLEMVDKRDGNIRKMVSPVNNFLKDLTQIERELHHEWYNAISSKMSAGEPGIIVPIEEALSGMMEENY